MSVLRWVVPVDGEVHALPVGGGDLGHVDCRRPDEVEVWKTATDETVRHFTVVGTGRPLPAGSWHVGTALTPEHQRSFPGRTPVLVERGALVWHLLELASPLGAEDEREAQQRGGGR